MLSEGTVPLTKLYIYIFGLSLWDQVYHGAISWIYGLAETSAHRIMPAPSVEERFPLG